MGDNLHGCFRDCVTFHSMAFAVSGLFPAHYSFEGCTAAYKEDSTYAGSLIMAFCNHYSQHILQPNKAAENLGYASTAYMVERSLTWHKHRLCRNEVKESLR